MPSVLQPTSSSWQRYGELVCNRTDFCSPQMASDDQGDGTSPGLPRRVRGPGDAGDRAAAGAPHALVDRAGRPPRRRPVDRPPADVHHGAPAGRAAGPRTPRPGRWGRRSCRSALPRSRAWTSAGSRGLSSRRCPGRWRRPCTWLASTATTCCSWTRSSRRVPSGVTDRTGTRLPAHSTASGKVLLAHLDRDELHRAARTPRGRHAPHPDLTGLARTRARHDPTTRVCAQRRRERTRTDRGRRRAARPRHCDPHVRDGVPAQRTRPQGGHRPCRRACGRHRRPDLPATSSMSTLAVHHLGVRIVRRPEWVPWGDGEDRRPLDSRSRRLAPGYPARVSVIPDLRGSDPGGTVQSEAAIPSRSASSAPIPPRCAGWPSSPRRCGRHSQTPVSRPGVSACCDSSTGSATDGARPHPRAPTGRCLVAAGRRSTPQPLRRRVDPARVRDLRRIRRARGPGPRGPPRRAGRDDAAHDPGPADEAQRTIIERLVAASARTIVMSRTASERPSSPTTTSTRTRSR